MPRPVGINHAAVDVGDIDEALAWFEGIFGELELRGRRSASPRARAPSSSSESNPGRVRLEPFAGARDGPGVVPAEERAQERSQDPQERLAGDDGPVPADVRLAVALGECPDAAAAQV